MPSETTALSHTTHHEALPAADAARLARALEESADATLFVNGTAVRLPGAAVDAVMDVLRRLAAGEAVTVGTAERWLNTSQAAQLAGVSNTYMRNLTDAGTIPVEYRGTHRRIRPADVLAWVAAREKSSAKGQDGQGQLGRGGHGQGQPGRGGHGQG